MTSKEIYKIWAPSNSIWSPWVRPVPFIAINNNHLYNELVDIELNSIEYIDKYDKKAAFIIDLPGYESIEESLSLALKGYRPIPVFNGTIEEVDILSTTNNHIIVTALEKSTNILNNIEIDEKANPAFLLDTERLNRYKMDFSVFDNSWDIYDQDLPTAEFFLKNKINKIILRSKKISRDLKKVLYKYQQKSIDIYFTNGYEIPKKVIIKKPSKKELKQI